MGCRDAAIVEVNSNEKSRFLYNLSNGELYRIKLPMKISNCCLSVAIYLVIMSAYESSGWIPTTLH